MSMLKDHHVLITGGGTGIGAAIARALAAEGAALSLLGRRIEPLQTLAQQLPRATGISCDVTDMDSLAQALAAARGAHGPVDIVIANAGAAESAPFARIDAAQWQRMLAVNLTGAFNTVQAALGDVARLPVVAGTVRRVVFVASTAGLKGYAYVAPYVAAKHGVVGLMRALAVECASLPLTVNAVCPGFTETPMLERSVDAITVKTGRNAEEARAALARANPQGRLITP
ncbi:MAG: SDR family NAD(P)-dependent oxidoreductase, partial [Beijerinckiaceae bacterium]